MSDKISVLGGYRAQILCDSVSPWGDRLTTFEVTFPRIVLAEFNTHRMFSRNSASSRAIPTEKILQRVRETPFIPIYWGRNQKGMSAHQELSASEQVAAERAWLGARDDAIAAAEQLMEIGVHKQIANRLLEPFMWHTVLVTATEWSNFFALRCAKTAQPEIRRIALMMRELYLDEKPHELGLNDWHTPLVSDQDRYELTTEERKQVASGRCARVSYLTHAGKRDPSADIDLHDRLAQDFHMSPFEHIARPFNFIEHYSGQKFSANFRGFVQYRKEFPYEHDAAMAIAMREAQAAVEDSLIGV